MTRTLVLLASLLTIVVSCRSNDRKPEDVAVTPINSDQPPAKRQFATWLATFNAADRVGLVAWHEKNFPYGAPGGVAAAAPAGIDDELAFRYATGGFDLKRTEESTATRCVTLVQEKDSEQFARATIGDQVRSERGPDA